MQKIKLPNITQRLAVVGRTGSGKTQGAVWNLSKQNFRNFRWYVIDAKMDRLINSIDGAEHISITDNVPKAPGLYITHPTPTDFENKIVEARLWDIWAQEKCGIFVDEGYMIGNSPAFRAVLTQGRSKKIPMIILSQRPVWLSQFVFSEADFYQVYKVNRKDDVKTIKGFVPRYTSNLPAYHSIWHDVGEDITVIMKPVPLEDDILDNFEGKLGRRKKFI